MPLHDWSNPEMWSGVHTYWLVRLADHIQPLLPEGYRAYLGTLPYRAISVTVSDADVKVVQSPGPYHTLPVPVLDLPRPAGEPEPDAVATMEAISSPDVSLFVEYREMMVSAIEIVSPRNKDRPEARIDYGTKYAGYLRQMVNLMVLDLIPRPKGFSFADYLADALQIPQQPPTPAPVAVSYRIIGGLPKQPALLEVWRRPLQVGQALPQLPLAVSPSRSVLVDLEATYMQAARSAFLP